jgi:hypothetical protein
MTEHETFPGKLYAVMCATGCTLTDDSGRNEEIEAGKQFTFIATAGKVYTSEPATVRLATFNRAASALGLLGGGVKVDLDKYAHCVTVADMQAVNPDYKNDLTKDGAWVYKLPNMTNLNSAFAGSAVRRFAVELPNVTSLQRAFEGSDIEIFKSTAPKHASAAFSITFSGCKSLEVVDCDMSNVDEIFQNFSNCPKLRVVTSSFPKVKTMFQAFKGTQLDKESSVRILTSVPAPYTDSNRYTINIGIHIDLKADADVVAAIAAAEEKGWVVAVQWNGTATAAAASTYRLRRNPVYAKPGEPMEDGTRVLDWGHYVTNAVENGYTEFSSLEEAKEHFNIID